MIFLFPVDWQFDWHQWGETFLQRVFGVQITTRQEIFHDIESSDHIVNC